jgi:hypothetical protein
VEAVLLINCPQLEITLGSYLAKAAASLCEAMFWRTDNAKPLMLCFFHGPNRSGRELSWTPSNAAGQA